VAVNWQLTADVPPFVKGHRVVACTPAAFGDVDFVFSALDANVAGEVEAAFADAGVPVFSNARNYRMVPDVPLIVPPVNGDHVALVAAQKRHAAGGGFIVTNANCSTTGMVREGHVGGGG
jgi:aspartate-semialdehyde dehydrogenase